MQKQLTRRVLDKAQILQVFAQYVARKHGGIADDYIQDQNLLDDYVKNDKVFPWVEIAAQVNLDRWRLYHWYFETFQRMLAGSIEKEDVTLMRDLIKKAMTNDEPLDKQFQQFVKTSLSKDYHRSSFSIAFNNTKRQVMKELGKTELPASRPIIRMESQLELQQLIQRQHNQIKQNQKQQFEQRQVNFQNLAQNIVKPQPEQSQAKPAVPAPVKSEVTPAESVQNSSTPMEESFQNNSFITEHVTTCTESQMDFSMSYETSVAVFSVEPSTFDDFSRVEPEMRRYGSMPRFIVFDHM
ncbi:Conserved_hypothetical protein [Hexamita inflata]|uniref:Uncharacterized protein n=1 Tax=Hexamita inflata TaxID=28002 RepID=A0AA86TSC4_9EUKA|nr:Conserved hypothetical protein [Hexamita inflata]